MQHPAFPCFGVLRLWAVGLALLGLWPVPSAQAQPPEPASVMIVFDGSGSMWGPIDGTRQSKFATARDALRRALGRIGPEVKVGLTSFGHRRGDCGDVEVRRAEPFDIERIAGPLDRMNPRGRGPVTLALREAAKSLAGEPGSRTLVLIHDDADNCQQDLCALAAELALGGFRAHVVSLAPKPEDLAKMSCLSEATGGRLFYTQNVEQAEAAIDDAMRLASNGAVPPLRPVPPGASQPDGAAASAEGKPGLSLRALLAEGTQPVAWPIQWTVMAAGEAGAAAPSADAGRSLFAARAVNPTVDLAPGRYRVEARDGTVAAARTVEVGEKGPTAADVVLNAGTLRVRAQWQRSGAPVGDGVISIAAAGQDTGGRGDASTGALVASVRGSEANFIVPAGRYVVVVEEGLVRAQRSVVVPAGSQGRVDMALNGARIRLSAVLRDGMGQLDAPVFGILEDDPDAPGGRREIARSAAREAEFVVPPGTYHVTVRQEGLEGREVVAVGPGDTVRRTLSLAAGKLVLQSRLAGGSQPSGNQVSYRVEQLDGPDPQVIATSRQMPELLVGAGRYRIEARFPATNARAIREVDLKSGQTLPVTMEFAAATVRMRLASGAGVQSEPFWTVRDAQGRTVWAAGQAEPTTVLQAGRYLIRAETQEKHFQRVVDLDVGETRLIELGRE